ncbi:hypothetical protein Mapa_012711 [Marchantia paleacea]|nr:hypothetical protein Mapa_012711 [Marchantia paleacea]
MHTPKCSQNHREGQVINVYCNNVFSSSFHLLTRVHKISVEQSQQTNHMHCALSSF